MTNSNDSKNSPIEKLNLEKTDWRGAREWFQSLEDELRQNLENERERYNFTWVGKNASILEAGRPIDKTLSPDVDSSVDFDTTKNLFIEGDNLDALKLLRESYLGKVKMIYIDPPYNTGKNLIYKNDFRQDKDDYLEESGQKLESTGRLVVNLETSGRFHSDWCSMFYSRIKIAKNLLRDDGFFVCAMDESEIANTIKICDDVFGEDNRLAVVTVVHKPEGRNQEKFFGTSHEYALFYAKNKQSTDFLEVVLDDEISKKYNLSDDNGNYLLKNFIRLTDGKYATRESKPNFYYPIYISKNLDDISLENKEGYHEVYPITDAGVERTWKTLSKTFMDLVENNNIVVTKEDHGLVIYEKLRAKQVIKTHWVDSKYHAYHHGTKVVTNLLGKKCFDFPKSIFLMKDILKLTTKDSDLVLDFFSGSATTAHAIMQLNAEDGNSRQWIMVQLPENLDVALENASSEEKQTIENAISLCDELGRPHFISEVSKERVRRAGSKIREDFADKLTEREAPLDTGFRALTVTDTLYQTVEAAPNETVQDSLLESVDNLKTDRTPLDLLFATITEMAMTLDAPLETRTLAGTEVFLYDYSSAPSGLIACFAENVSLEVATEIAKLSPLHAVFRDSSFPTSEAKLNLVEIFRLHSPNTTIKVI